MSCGSSGYGCADAPVLKSETQTSATTGVAVAVYHIENMDCPTEEALIRGKLGGVPGVVELDFNLMRRTLTVRHTLASLAPVEQALAAVDMQAVRQDDRSAVQTTRLAIAKMDCPSEEALIRSNLATLAGVIDLDFNLMQRTLTVRHAPAVLPDVLGALQSLGFEAQVLEEANRTPASSAPGQTTTHWWPLGISLRISPIADTRFTLIADTVSR